MAFVHGLKCGIVTAECLVKLKFVDHEDSLPNQVATLAARHI